MAGSDTWGSESEIGRKASIKLKSYEPFRLVNVYKSGKKLTQQLSQRVKYEATTKLKELDQARRRA